MRQQQQVWTTARSELVAMASYWLVFSVNSRAGSLSKWCTILCTYLCMLPEEAAPAPLLRTTVSGLSLSSNPVRTSRTSACSHLGIKHETGCVCAIVSLGHTSRSVSRRTELLLELYICCNFILLSLPSHCMDFRFLVCDCHTKYHSKGSYKQGERNSFPLTAKSFQFWKKNSYKLKIKILRRIIY